MPPTGAETGGGHGGWGGVARQSGNMACLSSGAHVPGSRQADPRGSQEGF